MLQHSTIQTAPKPPTPPLTKALVHSAPLLLPDTEGRVLVEVEVIDNDEDVACRHSRDLPPCRTRRQTMSNACLLVLHIANQRAAGPTVWIYLTTSTSTNFKKQA